jgi:formylglycine-generating enzyme required for sulfatase activity
MARFETTQGLWKRVAGSLPGPLTAELPAGDDLPVGNVNFAEAEAFCERLTARGRQSGSLPSDWEFRLPTEAQWEYACRAGTTTATSFGDTLSSRQANFKGKPYNGGEPGPSLGRAARVGSYPANAWGLHDMHGNVGELTLDEYAPDTYSKLAPGPVDVEKAVRWPTKIFPRVVRGGSWYEAAPAARSAARRQTEEQEWKFSDPNIPRSPWWYTEEAAMAVGMRVLRPLKPLTDEDKKRVWEADHDDLRQDVRDRLREGRGAMGKTGKTLPKAVQAAQDLEKASHR